MGPQGSQGRPKDPSDTLQSWKYLKKVYQNEVHQSDFWVIFLVYGAEICLKMSQNEVLGSDFFVISWCMGPQGSQGRRKDICPKIN